MTSNNYDNPLFHLVFSVVVPPLGYTTFRVRRASSSNTSSPREFFQPTMFFTISKYSTETRWWGFVSYSSVSLLHILGRSARLPPIFKKKLWVMLASAFQPTMFFTNSQGFNWNKMRRFCVIFFSVIASYIGEECQAPPHLWEEALSHASFSFSAYHVLHKFPRIQLKRDDEVLCHILQCHCFIYWGGVPGSPPSLRRSSESC
jgi:hypothetical protein